MNKIASGVGVATALPILGWFGYEIGGAIDKTAVLGLNISYIVIPAFAYLVAGAIMWHFPIDARRHGIIVRGIERRNR